MTNELFPEHRRTLEELEAVIDADVAAFVRVGLALAEVRDRELWRPGYLGWTHYCEERWGFSRFRAHRLIDGALIAETLPIGQRPTSERQTRELSRLNPEDRPAAWEEAVAGMKRTGESRRLGPTQAEVRESVERRLEELGKFERWSELAEWADNHEPLGPKPPAERQPAPVIVDLRWTFNRFDKATAGGMHPDDRAELLEELLPMWRRMLDRLEGEAR